MRNWKWLSLAGLTLVLIGVGYAISGKGMPSTPPPTFSLIMSPSTSRHEFMSNGMFEERYSFARYDIAKPYNEVVAIARRELTKGSWSTTGKGPNNYLKSRKNNSYKQDEWEVWIYEETSPRVTRVLVGRARGQEWKARLTDAVDDFF